MGSKPRPHVRVLSFPLSSAGMVKIGACLTLISAVNGFAPRGIFDIVCCRTKPRSNVFYVCPKVARSRTYVRASASTTSSSDESARRVFLQSAVGVAAIGASSLALPRSAIAADKSTAWLQVDVASDATLFDISFDNADPVGAVANIEVFSEPMSPCEGMG